MADTPPGPPSPPRRPSWQGVRAVFRSSAQAGKPGQNVGGYVSEEEHSRQGAEMQKRLSDPRAREELRAQERAQVVWMHPDLGQVLDLDPNTESQLIEVLTDRQMIHLEQYWSGGLLPKHPATAADFADLQRQRAEEQTRRLEELRNVLGEEGLQRYHGYLDTLHQRQWIRNFSERLPREDQLTRDQSARLMVLLRQQFEAHIRGGRFESSRFHRAPPPADDDARQKHTVALNERSFWRMQAESQELISRLPEILTQSQTDVFVQMEMEKIDAQRTLVEQLRADAGMSREIPAPEATDDDSQPKPVPGPVKLEVSVKVDDDQPTIVSLVTENGQPVGFEGPQSLWIEATPTVFADGWVDVQFHFHEQSGGQRRALRGSPGMGLQSRRPKPLPLGTHSMRTTISGSSRGYAIAIDARVTPAGQ